MIGNSWDNILSGEYQKSYFKELISFVEKEYKDKFKQQLVNPSDLFTIATYDFNLSGDPVEDDVFYECWIEDVSKEDANGKFTVKGGAKRMKF